MSATMFFGIVVSAWILIGLVTAIVMGRRGHALYPWMLLGAVFGPLVVLLAIEARRRGPRGDALVLAHGSSGRGRIDVLVGIDGSPQSAAALRAACSILGGRIGRLTLAAVLDYDTLGSVEGAIEESKASDTLAGARRLTGLRAQTEILRGKPAEVLAKRAIEGGYDLIVVGSRGRGLSEALLGSVATILASEAPVPVLVGGGEALAPARRP